MKEGMWYKLINPANAPCYPGGQRVPLTEGDFWLLSRDDGSSMPEFSPVEGEWSYLQKDRFDPTPYIRKASGRFAPKKEESMIEGKWYKCIESGSGVKAGEYYRCTEVNTGGSGYHVYSCWVSTSGSDSTSWNTRFDPTPHERTVFPNAPDLIERVRRIDPAAAEWLEFGDHSTVINFNAGKGNNLDDMMVWNSTPQGYLYWERIHGAVDYEGEETPVPKDEFKKGEHVEVRDDEDEDWEEAVFLCMDEESEFPYVAKPYGVVDGFKFCRRPAAPARPHIEPGTPIEVWDDEGDKRELRRFARWNINTSSPYVVSTGGVCWRHCRVLAPTGVEV